MLDFELTLGQLNLILEDYFNEKFPETRDKHQSVNIFTSLEHQETVIQVSYNGYN